MCLWPPEVYITPMIHPTLSSGNQGRELLPQPLCFISTLGSGPANAPAGLPAPSASLSESYPPAKVSSPHVGTVLHHPGPLQP